MLLKSLQATNERSGFQIDHDPVDSCPAVAELSYTGEDLLVKPLASPYDRTEDGYVFSLMAAEDTV